MRQLGYSAVPVTIAFYVWMIVGNILWGTHRWPGWADDLTLAWFLFWVFPFVAWEIWFIRTRARRKKPGG